jgi:hypothetical protein
MAEGRPPLFVARANPVSPRPALLRTLLFEIESFRAAAPYLSPLAGRGSALPIPLGFNLKRFRSRFQP